MGLGINGGNNEPGMNGRRKVENARISRRYNMNDEREILTEEDSEYRE